jgi:hypothetical protein
LNSKKEFTILYFFQEKLSKFRATIEKDASSMTVHHYFVIPEESFKVQGYYRKRCFQQDSTHYLVIPEESFWVERLTPL